MRPLATAAAVGGGTLLVLNHQPGCPGSQLGIDVLRHVCVPPVACIPQGSFGVDHHLAVLRDVPAKLAARVRLFDTGHNRKTDARDAHSIAMVAVRTKDLRVLAPDGELEVLRMLADRRDELSRMRVQIVNPVHRLLSELLPGQAKKDITALQAKAMLATVRPRDIVGKTRRRIAAEQITELIAVEKKIKKSTADLKAILAARGSRLTDIPGVGPVVAARILAEVGDVARSADRNRFASWTGTAPLDASSGEHLSAIGFPGPGTGG